MAGALRDALGLIDGLAKVELGGMTDRAIVREAAGHAGRSVSEQEIDATLDRYLALLEGTVQRDGGYVIHPGVEALLERLVPTGIALGLGTGNLERGARIKLEPAGLNRFFSFGGFGSDAESRPALLEAGVRRAESLGGRAIARADVWIVGDTLRDISAARAIGAKVLAVATGRPAFELLAGAEPDLCVRDLTDPRAAAVLGLSG